MYKLIFCISFFITINNANAKRKVYTEVPALIHLYAANQSDTNGFNLVEELPKLLYKQIIDGKITLWDSPKKQVAISPNALRNIENSNNASFSNVESLFINELWTSNRRKTDFFIAGFSFLAETDKGRVSFGYIDALEAIKILANNTISTNVNGPAELSFINALYSRKYDFALIQFGNTDFSKNIALAQKIKNDAFYSKKKVSGLYQLPTSKMLSYVVDKNLADKNDAGIALIKGLENFLNTNKEIFFEIGGSKYYDFQTFKNELSITRIEIVEEWRKNENVYSYLPKSIKIYTNNKPLNTLTFEEIEKWNLLIQFKSIYDILAEKNYLFSIFKFNNTLIPPDESALYLKALKEYKWTQVSNYVKYSRNN